MIIQLAAHTRYVTSKNKNSSYYYYACCVLNAAYSKNGDHCFSYEPLTENTVGLRTHLDSHIVLVFKGIVDLEIIDRSRPEVNLPRRFDSGKDFLQVSEQPSRNLPPDRFAF